MRTNGWGENQRYGSFAACLGLNGQLKLILLLISCLLAPISLAAPEKLHIALGDNYGLHATRINGEPAGIQKDLLTWFLSDYMALDIEIEAMPWKRAQMRVVDSKTSDGYFTAYTRKRVEELKLVPSARPFYVTHVKMHTWKGNPKIPVLTGLKTADQLLAMGDVRHVFLGGHGYHEEQLKGAKQIHRVGSVRQVPKFLLEYKRADLFIEQSELFYPLAIEAGLIDKVVTLNNIKFKSLRWHLYIRPDSEHVSLMSSVDQALDRAIEQGVLLSKIQEIFAKYGLSYSE